MKGTTSFLVRVALMAVALALAVVFVGRGADTPIVEATTFNPVLSVNVADPAPGVNSDMMISFSIPAPDAFVNVTDKSTFTFIPEKWGVNANAPLGTIGGTFDALATLGILGITPCAFSIQFNPTMYVSSVDTGYDPDTGTYDPDRLTSALDLGGHPGGPGNSGQFVPDPNDPDGLYGGITRYPDFLAQMFPPEEVGEPLLRLFGGQNVLLAAIPLNIVMFRPGQLEEKYGWGPELGYPTVTVLLDPVAPVDLLMLTITSDLCTPLALVNTNFGISQDNPTTDLDEGGIPLMTNPKVAGDYVFSMDAWAQPDADNDGIENWVDTCLFAPNTEDVDGRHEDGDGDGLDGACDPDPLTPSPSDPSMGVPDEDMDGYANRADNCPLVANGIHMDPDSIELLQIGEFVFPYAEYYDVIGPDNQADADGDRIGDACEGAEVGDQCTNNSDDDDDGLVNDGCPIHPPSSAAPESGAQCDNAADDDLDGAVNDGCPSQNNAESGAQCANADDDDLDGKVNDGCPTVTNAAESGAQCDNDSDDDGDGKVNDGCPRFPSANAESGAMCDNNTDDDFDGVVNDGCPRFPSANAESGDQCTNAVDDDWDGMVNDGCPGKPIYEPAPDLGLPLVDFIWDLEMHSAWYYDGRAWLAPYRDNDASMDVTPGDTRYIDITQPGYPDLAAGIVAEGDWDADESSMPVAWGLFNFNTYGGVNERHDNTDGNGQMNYYERIYSDLDNSGDVSNGDKREFVYGGTWGTIVGAPWYQTETGAQCANNSDDNANEWVNEGCPTVNNSETGAQCTNADDDDLDGKVNDGCSTVDNSETGAQCDNNTDDDLDGKVNDGCPRFPTPNYESGAQCDNALDDDFDGVVNDGCPNFPTPNNESGAQCLNADDDDFDGKVNDGCPTVALIGDPETGDQCENALDDDDDGRVNDGCPAIDPGDVAKNTETGHTHHEVLEYAVTIMRHGVKLNALGGPKKVNPSVKTYNVDVSNISKTAEDIQVALKVVPASCAIVSGPTSVNVGPGGSGLASFTVDWTACPADEYILTADACHAGDPAPAGFFGVGACPGTSDGLVDTNSLDDAPIPKDVTVRP